MTIAVGILLLPLEKLSGFRLSRYAQKSTLLALAAAMCTVGYSMADSRALSILGAMPDPPWGRIGVTLWRTALTGATIFSTYTLVLFAMYLRSSASPWRRSGSCSSRSGEPPQTAYSV